MAAIPPPDRTGPALPSHTPAGPTGPESPAQSAYDAELLKSPFAKMFAKTGAEPTAKEMQAIINNILKSVIDAIKQQEAQAKKAADKLKRVIEDKDD